MKAKQKVALLLILVLAFGLLPVRQAYAEGIAQENIFRYGGSNRYNTAIEISKAMDEYLEDCYEDNGVKNVVIATGSGFADALAASPLASAVDASILLCSSGGLTQETLDEIQRIDPETIYLIGGTGVVPDSVIDQVNGLGLSVGNTERIGGINRYETAVNIAYKLKEVKGGKTPGRIFLTYSQNFPDALSISPYAARWSYPILFASSGELDPYTVEYLNQSKGSNIVAIGGPTLISAEALQQAAAITGGTRGRIYGRDRYETSAKIALQYTGTFSFLSVATGSNFPDALAGSVLAAKKQYAILLVNNNQVDMYTRYVNRYYGYDTITVFGGTGVVSDATIQSLYSLPAVSGETVELYNLEPKPLKRRLQDTDTYVEITEIKYRYEQDEDGTYSGRIFLMGTRTSGSDPFKIQVSMYDADNEKIMEATQTQQINVGVGESFAGFVDFENLTPGVYEVFIFDRLFQ